MSDKIILKTTKQVNKVSEALAARPKNKKGFSRSLLGEQLHVVLALAGGGSEGAGGGAEGEFDCDMLKRCVEEFFADVSTARQAFFFFFFLRCSLPPAEWTRDGRVREG